MRILCLALALFAAACAPQDQDAHPRNVLFILVDTLRADHLGVYGYGRDTSPNLDALAREAVLFADARSQASCTFPSVNSILTSRYTAVFLGQPDKTMGIPQGVPPLAEILRGRGYRTAAVSASPVVRKSPSRFNPTGGYDRGFERFHEDCLWKPAECVNRAALEQLNALNTDDGRPFFLYLHYMDPHGPYAPPAEYARRFAISEPDKKFIRDGNPNPIGDMLYKGAPDPGVTPADLQHLVDLYDDEISYFDTRLAELIAALRESGRLDDTVLVLASDHGEEFLEHGHIKHCRTLFDTSVKVPLLMKVPGVGASAVPHPVENVDIVPTLLDYLGIDTAGLTLEGESLRPLIEGEAPPPESGGHQLASQGPWRSVADDRFKLIQDLAAGSFALYDLDADPGETTDVLRRERRAFHELREALTAWLAITEGEAAAGESLRQAEEAEKKLRSLGYLE
ncbi:MAG TPA: sulfatase [Thermoanaerobaculia bacterium]|nr:sulfatase [Thermoanaerobaculia bacterium]